VALTVDFDRTLVGTRPRPTRTAREALAEAKAMGLKTLLVSGRTYPLLRRFARAFPTLDGIVAENGAVVEAPFGRRPVVVGGRVAAQVRERLAPLRGLRPHFGLVVASVLRKDRGRVQAAVRGLSIRVTANRDRVMVLPRAVTKESGVRLALRGLGVSGGAFAAIGDAENDVDLLRAAGLAGAVANATPEVRRLADYVAQDRYARGVREFVRGPIRDWLGSDERPLNGARRGPARAPR
jgi:hydroxymethylpyrimidine pyrophosphatase-like HAD family hydrolase